MRPAHQTVKRILAKRTLFGIGVNDLPRPKLPRGMPWVIVSPHYTAWHRMLGDCYGRYSTKSVCGDWLTFSKFADWMDTKNYDDRILYCSTETYCPESCVFLPSEVLDFMGIFKRTKRELRWNKRLIKNKFIVFGDPDDKPVICSSEEDAYATWRQLQFKRAQELVTRHDPDVVLAIQEYLLSL